MFPMTPADMKAANLSQLDFVYVTGDAFIDHPSFGVAIIARVLQDNGYTVGIIAQPDWHSADDFRRLGEPRLGYLVTSGNIDSMVNHYTVAKHQRSEDAYTPGGKAGKRPDRAVIVYANRCREAYRNVPIIIGGIEASLRRFAHYDYWDDRVRHSILYDACADILLYGMGENSIVEVANALRDGKNVREITDVRGSCYRVSTLDAVADYIELPSYQTVRQDKDAYAKAFMAESAEQDAIRGKRLVQAHEKGYLVANPPALPLTTAQLDHVYALPYTYLPHPSYKEHIPALDEVRFSITSARGCYGGCSFCALTFHQGRVIQARSHASILKEAERMTHERDFKGYIHDVGGPTANFRQPACEKQKTAGTCANRQCIGFSPCKNLRVSHSDYLELLQKLRALPGIKKVFVRSGIRYDYMMYDKDRSFFKELVAHHISGQLKVAPEHVSDRVLYYMNKPKHEVYERFAQAYAQMNKAAGKDQYVVPYLISSHPGCQISDAIELTQYLKKMNHHPEQVQDFYPTPGTLSTCMYYTGKDPRTMEPVYVPRSPEEKAMQRALMQWFLPRNFALVRKALQKADRDDLIGYEKECLVPPAREQGRYPAANAGNGAARRGKGQEKRSNAKNAVDKRRRNR